MEVSDSQAVVKQPLGGYAFEAAMAGRLFKECGLCKVLDMSSAMTSCQVSVGDHLIDLFGWPDDPYFMTIQQVADGNTTWEKALGLLPDDAVILDVGANIGATSVLAAKRRPLTFHAFEPSPRARACLTASIQHHDLGDQIEVVPMAVGSAAGVTNFFEHPFLAGSHRTQGEDTLESRQAVSVGLTSVDDYVFGRELERVDMIKIDVEGFEIDVLDGAVRTFEKYAPIVVMEFNAWCITAFKDMSPRRLLDEVRERFGVAWVWRGDGLRRLESPDDYLSFLHSHLIQHGCVDDLIFSADGERLQSTVRANWPQAVL